MSELPATNYWLDRDPEYAAELMKDIRRVGIEKPLGYLPLDVLLDCGVTLSATVSEAQTNGNEARYFVGRTVPGFIGSVYVYHVPTLEQLLTEHDKVLTVFNWPQDVHGFVQRVAFDHTTEYKTPLYTLIADAFADFTNPFRSDTE